MNGERHIHEHERLVTERDIANMVELPGYGRNSEGLLCLPSFVTLSPEERSKICNGVGGCHGISQYAPDTVWGLSLKQVADIHDHGYFVGGDVMSKYYADLAFLYNCFALINEGSWWLRWLRKRRARQYFWLVRKFGDQFFNFI